MTQYSAIISTTNISALQIYLDQIILGKDNCLLATRDNHAHPIKSAEILASCMNLVGIETF